MFNKTMFKVSVLIFLLMSILPVGKLSAQEDTKNATEKNNAINLLPAFASLVTTLIMLPITADDDTGYLVLGIGYERKIVDHFSIYGDGLFVFTFNPNYFAIMDLNLTGRYYFNEQFTGFYLGLGLNYFRMDMDTFLNANRIGVNALAGYKFRKGSFYIEPQAGLSVSFGKMEVKIFDVTLIDYENVGLSPVIGLNMGILF